MDETFYFAKSPRDANFGKYRTIHANNHREALSRANFFLVPHIPSFYAWYEEGDKHFYAMLGTWD